MGTERNFGDVDRIRSVLKVHVHGSDLWERGHPANLLFQEHLQLLNATHGYLLFKLVDAQPVVRSLAAVIDWEIARIAPPLCEVAILVRFTLDGESESAVLGASLLGLSDGALSARCYDLIRISLGLSKPDLTGDDVPIWADYVNACAMALLENDPEPARAASTELLTLP